MKKTLLLINALLFVVSTALLSRTIVVSKTTLPGAYSTINEATAIAVAGDTVLVMAGVYNEKVIVQHDGDANRHLTLQSKYDSLAIIDGTGIAMDEWGNGLIHIDGLSYIDVVGFKVTNSSSNGIYAHSSDHIRVRKCTTNNTKSSGIGIWNSSKVLVDSNEVVLACNGGAQECISVAGCDSFEICHNHVRNNGVGLTGGEGIDSKHGRYGWVHDNHVHDLSRLGIYVDAWNVHMHHVWVYNNHVHNCNAWGIALADEDGGLLSDVYVYNNIAHNNVMMGIGAEADNWGVAGTTHQLRNIHIYNNTCYNNGGTWGAGVHVSGGLCDSIFVRNNIVASNKYAQLLVENDLTNMFLENNLVSGTNSLGTTSNNQITANPMFVNGSKFDFHLLASSPAIGKATLSDCPDFDFDYNKRSTADGKYPDVGAFEYQSGNSLTLPKEIENFYFYPNPSSSFITVLAQEDEARVELVNLYGQIVCRFASKPFPQIIDISSLDQGLYVIRIVKDKTLLKSAKLIKSQ